MYLSLGSTVYRGCGTSFRLSVYSIWIYHELKYLKIATTKMSQYYYALALGWVIAWNRPILPPSGYVAPESVRPALILQSHCSIINHIKTKEKKIASYLLDEVLLQSRCHEFPVEKKNHNWPSQLKELLWTEQRGKERIFITESFRNQLRFVFLQSFIT